MQLACIPVTGEVTLPVVRSAVRRASELLGLPPLSRVKLATAVSEVARNIYEYAGKGSITLLVEEARGRRSLRIIAEDQGPGISNLDRVLDGTYASETGMGVGLRGARALVSDFEVASTPESGTRVTLTMSLPEGSGADYGAIRDELRRSAPPDSALFAELQDQNRALVRLLEELNESKFAQEEANTKLAAANAELALRAARLVESETVLRTRNDELKSFAYTVSHDLKAPLRGIVGYAQEIERKHIEPLGERGRFCVSQILVAGRNLDRLIDDLLRYSRLDAESLVITTVNVDALVRSIVKDRRLLIDELHADVSVEIGFESASTWERGLHQVLTNLIDNALKYSRGSKPPRVSISAEAHAGGWRIQVADNGIGFDMKYHDRIFGLFNRLAQATEFEGTGAGLAIVRKLLDRQGGTVHAESTPGAGATFIVELPRPTGETTQ